MYVLILEVCCGKHLKKNQIIGWTLWSNISRTANLNFSHLLDFDILASYFEPKKNLLIEPKNCIKFISVIT